VMVCFLRLTRNMQSIEQTIRSVPLADTTWWLPICLPVQAQ